MGSARSLETHMMQEEGNAVERAHLQEVIRDIDEMHQIVRDFKYFRVRFEDERTVDTGVESASTQSPREQEAAEEPTLRSAGVH